MDERAPPAGSGAPHALHRNWYITHAALSSTRPHGLGDTLDAVLGSVLGRAWLQHLGRAWLPRRGPLSLVRGAGQTLVYRGRGWAQQHACAHTKAAPSVAVVEPEGQRRLLEGSAALPPLLVRCRCRKDIQPAQLRRRCQLQVRLVGQQHLVAAWGSVGRASVRADAGYHRQLGGRRTWYGTPQRTASTHPRLALATCAITWNKRSFAVTARRQRVASSPCSSSAGSRRQPGVLPLQAPHLK